MSKTKSQVEILSELLSDANKTGKLKPKDQGCCQYTDVNGNSVCANNWSEFQCQQVAGTFTSGATCSDIAKTPLESQVEGTIPPHTVWAPKVGQCTGKACGYVSLTWNGSAYIARNNHKSRRVKVTLPGVWSGTADSVTLAPRQQARMLFTAFTNPWHADFA